MSRLFLDTGIFVAACSPRDVFHKDSRRILERIADGEWESVHTSDFVLAETLNFIVRKIKKREAMEFVLNLVFGSSESPPAVTAVFRVHAGRLAASIDALKSQFGRGLSLTDWSTVVLMREARIDALATFDGGFRGLVSLVKG